MQLKSVRDWDMVAALFELLWEEKARRIALRLVSALSTNTSFCCKSGLVPLKPFKAAQLTFVDIRPEAAGMKHQHPGLVV